MTPTELLEQAKSQFLVLYHTDATALGQLLAKALRKYQDKAGVIEEVSLGDAAELDLPDHFLRIATAQDATGNYMEASADNEKLMVVERRDTRKPYKIFYFLDLASFDADEDLPLAIIGTTLDYLVALIDIPNTQRARRTQQATGEQGDLPSDDALIARRDQIELTMEDEEAIIPMAVVRL